MSDVEGEELIEKEGTVMVRSMNWRRMHHRKRKEIGRGVRW